MRAKAVTSKISPRMAAPDIWQGGRRLSVPRMRRESPDACQPGHHFAGGDVPCRSLPSGSANRRDRVRIEARHDERPGWLTPAAGGSARTWNHGAVAVFHSLPSQRRRNGGCRKCEKSPPKGSPDANIFSGGRDRRRPRAASHQTERHFSKDWNSGLRHDEKPPGTAAVQENPLQRYHFFGASTSTSVTPPRRRSELGLAVLCTEMARV
jgi:hypothetical protein